MNRYHIDTIAPDRFALMRTYESAVALSRPDITREDSMCVVEHNQVDFPPAFVADAERVTGHEVEAVLRCVDPLDACPMLHLGLTSSDVSDYALLAEWRHWLRAVALFLQTFLVVLTALAKRSEDSIRWARTHGMKAIPTSAANLIDDHIREFKLALDEVEQAILAIAILKCSGPVGTYEHVGANTEAQTAQMLCVRPVRALQAVPRFRTRTATRALMSVCWALTRLAVNVRLLTMLDEFHWESDAVGSSCMPKKQNPWRAERVCGLCLMAKKILEAIEESGVDTWLERDLRHSSTERFFPDAVNLIVFCLDELTRLVDTADIKSKDRFGRPSEHDRMVKRQLSGKGRKEARG